MNNKKLMKKVIELDTQTLKTREQSLRVMIQISIIRKAFEVKNSETDAEVLDFKRQKVMSDQEIKKEFNQYVRFWRTAINRDNQDQARTFQNQIYYFIEGVRFFDEKLANELTELFEKS